MVHFLQGSLWRARRAALTGTAAESHTGLTAPWDRLAKRAHYRQSFGRKRGYLSFHDQELFPSA